jgi:putative FmdB family regulatory protein
MPTYEYKCTKCRHEFEQFQSMKDAALKQCPACKSKSLERLIGIGAAVIFKGSGFYQTDYRSEAYKKAQKADAPPTAAAEEKKSAEPKPDASSASPSAQESPKQAKAKSTPASKAEPKQAPAARQSKRSAKTKS